MLIMFNRILILSYDRLFIFICLMITYTSTHKGLKYNPMTKNFSLSYKGVSNFMFILQLIFTLCQLETNNDTSMIIITDYCRDRRRRGKKPRRAACLIELIATYAFFLLLLLLHCRQLCEYVPIRSICEANLIQKSSRSTDGNA